MNVFIDTKRLEKVRRILIILDIMAIILMIASYILSGYNMMGLLVHIIDHDNAAAVGTHHSYLLLLFLGFGFTIIFSIQLIVVQAIIRMVDDAYKYSTSKEEEIENKK